MNQQQRDELGQIVGPDNVLIDEPMSNHTTFRIGGPAEVFVEPPVGVIKELVDFCKNSGIPYTIIGHGSNLLVSDEGIEGVVICLSKAASSINMEGESITCEAGAMLGTVASQAAQNSLGGMEFAAGIPGSIGGAVAMNAGAYGGEMKDILVSATVLTQDGEIVTWSVDELDLSYRHSRVLSEGAVVLSAVLKLASADAADIKAKMDDFRQRRLDKQPLEYPSAGSTFKRPEGYFAGKLIQDSGLAGYTVGGACVSEKHCGFVINKGGATAADVSTLMKNVDAIVREKFGVGLEPEVRLIGKGF